MATHESFLLGQKAILIRDGRALILEASYMAGFWDLPGGRIHVGEDKDEALRREVKEEIGISDFKSLGIVDYALWRREGHHSVCLIAQLIENASDHITLSREHNRYQWVTKAELDQYRFVSDDMKRMLEKGFLYYTLRHAQ